MFDANGQFVARLDMGWRDLLRAVEFDGDDAHHSAEQQARDLARRERVERCGWGIAVVTGLHVLSRSLAFERGVAELLGIEMRLTRNHPRYGGWEPRSDGQRPDGLSPARSPQLHDHRRMDGALTCGECTRSPELHDHRGVEVGAGLAAGWERAGRGGQPKRPVM